MRKMVLILAVMIMIASSGCRNEQKTTVELPSNGKSEKQTELEETTKVSEDIEIDEEYLKERYPGKTILTWVYGETYKDTPENIEDFGVSTGKSYLFNSQIIELNDYLVSIGKDYVINYERLGSGDEYINEVKERVKRGEAPDFITAEIFWDATADVYARVMEYDFIGENLLEELDGYLDNELKDYIESVPENMEKLSRVNGKIYGLNTKIYDEPYRVNWYVNADIADKYGIDIDQMENMSFQDWGPYLDIVYQGEKEAGTLDLKTIFERVIPLMETSTSGYIGELNGYNYVWTNAFGINVDGDKIENYYADPEVKQNYKTYSEYFQKGYYYYLNPTKENKQQITTGNVFLYGDYEYSDTEYTEEEILSELQISFPRVKRIKKVTGEEVSTSNWFLQYPAITGICSGSNHKEKALDALNVIFSDEEITNIIRYPGYQPYDKDFTCSYEELEKLEDENEKYTTGSGIFTNPYMKKIYEGNKAGSEIREIIDSVRINEKFAGMLYDYTPVKEQVKKIMKIENKYIGESENGIFRKGNFEEKWEAFLAELEEAGIDEVLEYLNEKR